MTQFLMLMDSVEKYQPPKQVAKVMTNVARMKLASMLNVEILATVELVPNATWSNIDQFAVVLKVNF